MNINLILTKIALVSTIVMIICLILGSLFKLKISNRFKQYLLIYAALADIFMLFILHFTAGTICGSFHKMVAVNFANGDMSAEVVGTVLTQLSIAWLLHFLFCWHEFFGRDTKPFGKFFLASTAIIYLGFAGLIIGAIIRSN